MDIIQPIYLGKETSNQLGFVLIEGLALQFASGNFVRAVLFYIFLVPPTSSFLGVEVYHLLWFVNGSMAVATAFVGPCPKSDLCRHLLFTRARGSSG